MATPFEKTVDGFESQFGVNHLGPFLFKMLLVRKLARGGRIVNVSSTGYAFGGVRFDDPNFEVSISSAQISNRSSADEKDWAVQQMACLFTI
jgi:NAD(P)-dependent dehydrogenase (short-subunit alcohol dehydrogenase family)